jgi:hypothetical protein
MAGVERASTPMFMSGMGATFHPDSWDFDAGTYTVRDAGEETMYELAQFYGVPLQGTGGLNQANLASPYYGNPAIYGAVVGNVIQMPAAARTRALAMDCPAGFSRDARGYCVIDTTKGKLCPAGQSVDPSSGLCYDPAKTSKPPGPAKPPMSTGKKVAIGLGITATALGIGYTIFRFTREVLP